MAALSAALIWACSLSTFSHFAKGVSAFKVNLYKNCVAVICFAVTIALTRPMLPSNYAPLLQLAASGMIGLAIGDSFLLVALTRLGAQLTAASQCLSPPFTAIIAFLFLGEALSPNQLGGMILTTGAVAASVLFTHNSRRKVSDTIPLSGVFFAVCAALANAIGIVIARNAFQHVDIILGTGFRILPAILLLLLFGWRTKHSDIAKQSIFEPKKRAIALTVASFFGTFLGVLLLSFGTKYSKAGVAASLSNTYPLWIIPIAVFVLKETRSWRASLCTLVAVAGILLMLQK